MAANGTITLKPGMGYILWNDAERLNLTVAKLLTGKDLPYSNIERTLTNTYALAQQKLKKQQGRGHRPR